MIIGVDGNEANVLQQVGVSVYTLNLLKFFQQWADEETQFRIYLKEKPNELLPPETKFFQYRVVKGSFMWSRVHLPLHLNLKKEIDVFFAPAHYSPPFLPVPLIVTIHDLAFFYFPEEFLKKDLYKLENWTKASLKKAKKIISVSKSTKRDLMKFYHLPEENITVVYNGFEKDIANLDDKKNQTDVLEKFALLPQKYILYVGTIQPRKNIRFLIQTFKKFHEQFSDYKLVLTGRKGWLYDEIFAEVKEQNLQEAVVFTGYVEDEKVIQLYNNALCFVLPSLYEGFGIPLLEAMSFGCPVISSFASSLPEIGGEACLYFDPKTQRDFYDDLVSLKDNQQLRDELIQKGKERIKHFSWEKSAAETLDVIKSAV